VKKTIFLSILMFVFAATLLSAQSADFSVTSSRSWVGIVQPATGYIDDSSATITVSPVNGFSGTVNLSVDGGGLDASLSHIVVSGSGSVVLTVAVGASTPPGDYLVTVTGASGALSHSVQITYTVYDRGGNCGQEICPLN